MTNSLHRAPAVGLEAIPDAADGYQIPRLGRIVLDVAAEPDDEVVDGARVRILAHFPDLFENLLPRHRSALMLHEIAQKTRFHGRQLQPLLTMTQLEGVEVDNAVAKRKAI